MTTHMQIFQQIFDIFENLKHNLLLIDMLSLLHFKCSQYTYTMVSY